MATRDRTHVFLTCRARAVERKNLRGQAGDEIEMQGLLQGDDVVMGVAPRWLTATEVIKGHIKDIKSKMESLAQKHKKHLLPNFDEDIRLKEEQAIEILTGDITLLFKKCQGEIQRIGSSEQLDDQSEVIKKNMQSSLATQVQDLSLQFRKSQKDYMLKLRGREEKNNQFFADETDSTLDRFDRGFTDEQMLTVELANRDVSQREKEVLAIAQSINDLAEIFNDLAVLVVDQGTILDSIEYNIEQAGVHTEEAVKELRKGAEYQKSARTKLCILLLCVLILGVVISIIIKSIL